MGGSIRDFSEGRLGLVLGELLSGIRQLSVSVFLQINLESELSRTGLIGLWPGSSMPVFVVSLLQSVLFWRANTGPCFACSGGKQWTASERQMGEPDLEINENG